MLVYDIFVEGYNVQRVMRQMGLYQQVPVPVGLHLPPDVHTQKRQADNRYRRSMHSRMTPWIEAWSQALNDVTDIAGELVRDAKTLWEKLRDGMAGTNQEVMAAVDSLRRKGKRIMRLASCRHSSDVYNPATSTRTFEPMPECPSTSSRPSTSVRPSASARRSSDGRAEVRSTSFRDPPTIPTIPEITEISERLGGFGSTQEGTRMVRPVPHMPPARPQMIPQMALDVPTSHWQGGFAPFAGPTQSVPLHAPTYGTNPWQGQSIDYGGSFRPEIMSGFSPYTTSYDDMSSFGGGSSSVPNELRTSQTNDAPHVTQPT
uniref:Uncharacterized protein n=1 Tax=Oryza rufipogon TaxID=4529 RepID=A0A0E0Q147_ORYRU